MVLLWCFWTWRDKTAWLKKTGVRQNLMYPTAFSNYEAQFSTYEWLYSYLILNNTKTWKCHESELWRCRHRLKAVPALLFWQGTVSRNCQLLQLSWVFCLLNISPLWCLVLCDLPEDLDVGPLAPKIRIYA